jgi:hypothetical protein
MDVCGRLFLTAVTSCDRGGKTSVRPSAGHDGHTVVFKHTRCPRVLTRAGKVGRVVGDLDAVQRGI